MRMVNAGFPNKSGYGFEMVDTLRNALPLAWSMIRTRRAALAQSESRLSDSNRHQSKIYAESNHSGFSQIFGDLGSMRTLAIYRRLLIRADCEIKRNKT
jgi:hypothetical protein